MSDPTAEDFLVNQQIKDFAFDLHDATRRSHLAEDIKRLYTVEFKELSEKYCDKQPWPVAEAIASQLEAAGLPAPRGKEHGHMNTMNTCIAPTFTSPELEGFTG